jgi:hypothetical protein
MPNPMRRTCLLLLLAVPVLGGWDCGHELNPVHYAFTLGAATQNSCNLAVAFRAQSTQGTLTFIGTQVRMDDFTAGGMAVQMVGSYQYQAEAFYLDGSSANTSLNALGPACVADLFSVHFDATTDDATHFHGVLRVETTAIHAPACQCVLSGPYTAAAN